jgi:hypothetical protein
MYATYRREYENLTHLPSESIDALWTTWGPMWTCSRTMIMIGLSSSYTRWIIRFGADSLTVNELFSKLKSAEVDRGMTAKI